MQIKPMLGREGRGRGRAERGREGEGFTGRRGGGEARNGNRGSVQRARGWGLRPFEAERFLLGSRCMSTVDTSPQADARYHELLRRMPAEQRLEAAMRLSQAVRELALAGIRGRHPAADDHELRVRLTVRLYGRDCARRLFGDVPDDAI